RRSPDRGAAPSCQHSPPGYACYMHRSRRRYLRNKPTAMQELIERIQKEAGISEQQATAAAEAAKSFVRSKVPPMFNGLVDQLFSGKFDAASAMKAAQNR